MALGGILNAVSQTHIHGQTSGCRNCSKTLHQCTISAQKPNDNRRVFTQTAMAESKTGFRLTDVSQHLKVITNIGAEAIYYVSSFSYVSF